MCSHEIGLLHGKILQFITKTRDNLHKNVNYHASKIETNVFCEWILVFYAAFS